MAVIGNELKNMLSLIILSERKYFEWLYFFFALPLLWLAFCLRNQTHPFSLKNQFESMLAALNTHFFRGDFRLTQIKCDGWKMVLITQSKWMGFDVKGHILSKKCLLRSFLIPFITMAQSPCD